MTQQLINIGTVIGDHTGDIPPVAGDKINDNFTELYSAVAHIGAMVRLTSQLTLPTDGDPYYVPWGLIVYETPDGIVDLGVQPTRLTVPAGYAYARVTGQMEFNAPISAGFDFHLYFHRNGTGFAGYAGSQKLSVAGKPTQIQAITPWVPVVAGQYFEMYLQNDSPSAEKTIISDYIFCWMAIELKK